MAKLVVSELTFCDKLSIASPSYQLTKMKIISKYFKSLSEVIQMLDQRVGIKKVLLM